MSHVRTKPHKARKPATATTQTPASPVAAPAAPVAAPVPGVAYVESETAAFLRLKNPRTLATWRCTGRAPDLKYRRVGNRIIYLGEDIAAYLNATPTRAKAPSYVPKRKRGAR